MLCCMRRTKQVEKNDEDQKIEQDGIKPEDKAHKAATKIQASFRGHITRKKLKGEKKGEAQAAEAEEQEKKEDAPVADGVAKKEGEGPATAEVTKGVGPKSEQPGKAGDAASEEKGKGEGAPDAAPGQAAPQAAEEKAGSVETESAAKASPDNLPSSKAEDGPAKEEPKQADVPAAVTAAAAATTPAAEDAAAKATAQPPTDTAESSQAEEKLDLESPAEGATAGNGITLVPSAEAVDETKPKESARQDEGKEEEREADQEHA
ncbi:neuromodulin isoform X1 [Heterocephalus glaber]|uniref:Neuromodulin n=1 Tax=Heterocephalus glaber TaxID=10181 RepID=A0AAX6NS44_HETGA|nr:neuromodulin isoform X1 [Heterocephalus glaber]